jgi:hypothetical protein
VAGRRLYDLEGVDNFRHVAANEQVMAQSRADDALLIYDVGDARGHPEQAARLVQGDEITVGVRDEREGEVMTLSKRAMR